MPGVRGVTALFVIAALAVIVGFVLLVAWWAVTKKGQGL